ncbi:DMT family transporter [Gangjinia marincola]|uniref:DMT family transporter n=1 Tax=Gangjinia marincola TaxID=578463 RepID=A0ABN1MHP6_9FLAO
MSRRTLALVAAFTVSFIYALNHTIAKGLMPVYVGSFGLILIRVLGAAILFWITSIFTPKEKIDPKDWPRIVLCTCLGMVINMLMFFWGLELSTPINSSVLITISPILIFILSAFYLKEKITFKRAAGIFLGFAGALGLILFGAEVRSDAPNIPLGNFFFVINAISYAGYLVMVKSLTPKYHPVTLMKWFFLFAVIINFPISIWEFKEVQWSSLPFDAIWKIIFVIVGTTFMTYLLNVFALKTLKASTIGSFIYLQPLLAIIFAMLLGVDQLNAVKIIAAICVFTGVYLVTSSPKKKLG